MARSKSGHWFPVQSKAYRAFEKEALKQIDQAAQPIICEPVNIKYIFYRNTKRSVDALNLAEAIDDILVKAKILADDNRDIVAGHDGTRVYYDKDDPRTEVTITRMINYEQWKTRQEEG